MATRIAARVDYGSIMSRHSSIRQWTSPVSTLSSSRSGAWAACHTYSCPRRSSHSSAVSAARMLHRCRHHRCHYHRRRHHSHYHHQQAFPAISTATAVAFLGWVPFDHGNKYVTRNRILDELWCNRSSFSFTSLVDFMLRPLYS